MNLKWGRLDRQKSEGKKMSVQYGAFSCWGPPFDVSCRMFYLMEQHIYPSIKVIFFFSLIIFEENRWHRVFYIRVGVGGLFSSDLNGKKRF